MLIYKRFRYCNSDPVMLMRTPKEYSPLYCPHLRLTYCTQPLPNNPSPPLTPVLHEAISTGKPDLVHMCLTHYKRGAHSEQKRIDVPALLEKLRQVLYTYLFILTYLVT